MDVPGGTGCKDCGTIVIEESDQEIGHFFNVNNVGKDSSQ